MADLMGVGSLINGIGSIASTAAQAAEAERNRKFQAQEAQKQRDFNHAEAEISRLYNTQMVNSQNRYNSPAATAQRYKDAGMNPALAMSGGQLGSVGIGSVSQASSGASPSGSQADYSALANIGLVMEQGRLLAAQRSNVEADTKLKEIDAQYRAQGHQDAHKNAVAVLGKTMAETLNFTQITEESKERMNQIRANVDNIVADTTSKQFDSLLKGQQFDYNSESYKLQLGKLAAELSISEQQASLYMTAARATIALRYAEANNLSIDGDLKSLELDRQRSIEELQKDLRKSEAEAAKNEAEFKGSKGYIWYDTIMNGLERAVGMVSDLTSIKKLFSSKPKTTTSTRSSYTDSTGVHRSRTVTTSH